MNNVKVVIERFKRGGTQKFYDELTYFTNIDIYNIRDIEAEVRKNYIMKGFNFTIEVSKGLMWNKHLIPND